MEPDQQPVSQAPKSNTPYIITAIIVILVIIVVVVLATRKSNTNDQVANTTQQSTTTTPTDTMATTPTDTMGATPSTTTPTPSTTTPTPSATPSQGQVKSFTVEGKNFSFSPSTLTVNKGDTVQIMFKNTGGFHNWKIDQFNAETKTISDGQTDTIQFVADKSGSFEYYCDVGNHRAMGMKGTLVVK